MRGLDGLADETTVICHSDYLSELKRQRYYLMPKYEEVSRCPPDLIGYTPIDENKNRSDSHETRQTTSTKDT